MITKTIDDVLSIKAQSSPTFEPTLTGLCDFAIAQHEEIKRLRAELKNEKNWRKALKPCPQALLDAHEEIERLRDCIERALPFLRGHVHGGQHALMCEAVIDSLKSESPTNETGNAREEER